jgi:hypothetical protein
LSVASSGDGIVWSSPVVAVKTLNNSSESGKKRSDNSTLQFADKPWIVANSVSGVVNVVFNSQFPYVVSSFDKGRSWTAPLLMDNEITDPYYYFYAGGGGKKQLEQEERRKKEESQIA